MHKTADFLLFFQPSGIFLISTQKSISFGHLKPPSTMGATGIIGNKMLSLNNFFGQGSLLTTINHENAFQTTERGHFFAPLDLCEDGGCAGHAVTENDHC